MNYCPASFWLSQYVITPFLDTPASYAVNNISGLWFQPTPLKNDGVFQLWNSQLFMEKQSKCSKPPTRQWITYLVGGIPTPLKNMKVSWGYYSHIYIYPIKIPFNTHLQKAARRRRSPLQNPQAEAAQVLRTPGRHNEGTCAAALERCEKGGFHRGKLWKMPFFRGFTSKKWWTCGFWMVLSEKHMMNMWISRANCHENWDVTGQKVVLEIGIHHRKLSDLFFEIWFPWQNSFTRRNIFKLGFPLRQSWDARHMRGQKWKLYQQIWRCTKRNMDFSDIKIYPSELQWIYMNLPHKDGSKSTSGEKKHMS